MYVSMRVFIEDRLYVCRDRCHELYFNTQTSLACFNRVKWNLMRAETAYRQTRQTQRNNLSNWAYNENINHIYIDLLLHLLDFLDNNRALQ